MGTSADAKQSYQDLQWWRDAVIYQIYPRSFADSDGDGIGDLAGVTSRLGHVADLGVDAIWLSPFYPSPQRDGGYDVSDYCDVDPMFGTLVDFDALVERAHELGLRVIVDVVPNHTSTEHPWFAEALDAGPGSAARARYIFREGRDDAAPNNWESMFGGPAWTQVDDGQWYLHLFDSSQPDLDWTNPQIQDDLDDVLHFWLARGVDGFRIDVADGLVKAAGLPDVDLTLHRHRDRTSLFPQWDQPGVHDIYRHWRSLIDQYDRELILCGEAWVNPPEALARYVRPDELHQTFNFNFLQTPWNATAFRDAISTSIEHTSAVGAPATWVLSNHDVVRHATRLGRADATEVAVTDGIGPNDLQPDRDLGLRRARAATTMMLALPGSAYLYQGEELGLPDVTTLPDESRQDPRFHRTDGSDIGRDGCRVPMPWEPEMSAFGFSPTGKSWLPQPESYGPLAAAQQLDEPTSTWHLYRRLLTLRRSHHLGRSALVWQPSAADVLVFDVGPIRVVVNLGDHPVPAPDEAPCLVRSDANAGGEVLPDSAAWFAVDA